MSSKSNIEYYPLDLRVTSILIVIISIFTGILVMDIGINTGIKIIQEWNASSMFIFEIQSGLIVFVMIPFVIILFMISRSLWFYLYSYQIYDDMIKVIVPFSRKNCSIEFNKVKKVKTFIIFGEHRF